MASGYLILLLHAHLPYVRHPEYESFVEENWLFEGISETYLPIPRMQLNFGSLKQSGGWHALPTDEHAFLGIATCPTGP